MSDEIAVSPLASVLAEADLTWLTIYATSALIAAIATAIIMTTVWITGGLGGGR